MRAVLNTAIKVVRQTSSQLVRSFDQLAKPVEREVQSEMIARIQSQCFEMMVAAIKENRPTHKVQQADQLVDAEAEALWLVAPLIGEINFMQHNPNFFVGLAYYEKGQAKVSVIYDCLRNEICSAVAGQGTQYNDKKVRVSAHQKIEGAHITSQLPLGDVENRQAGWVDFYQKVNKTAQSFTCQSLGVLSIIQLVSGQVDAYITYQLDLATCQLGLLLLKEAGALLTDKQGSEKILASRTLVAANPKFVREILNLSRH